MVDDLAKACGTNRIIVLFSENSDLVSNIYNQTSPLETAIPETYLGDCARPMAQGEVPGNCYESTKGGCRGLSHGPVQGQKPVHDSCKASNNSAM